ncbi:MAG TPA: YhbY family RNA-binding protein [Candidatus Nanoarchaeia archaeon]|nr:YhbY family RNA-binding protein [Candidatus Nanoarchaeia archaeon]
MPTIGNLQLGKQGVTENFLNGLRSQFNTRENIKISVLKNATRDKKELKKFSDEILEGLGKNYTSRIIGFTIVVKKWRKNVR